MALFSWFNDSKQSPKNNQHTVLVDKVLYPNSSFTWPVMKVLKDSDEIKRVKTLQRRSRNVS